ncbi:MAG: hypothetical protein ABIE07_12405 [Candidatus Zixiibacteriota bacterium]
MKVSISQLISEPKNEGRHVVILGAGASKQAFPDGDMNGKIPPIMNELFGLLNIGQKLKNTGINFKNENFEEVYSELSVKMPNSQIIEDIDLNIREYFSSLQISANPTLYDHLILSLRPKDFVFTFNWDPFLYEAWNRNIHNAPSPKIAHLHGNVRIGYCLEHKVYGENGRKCPNCNNLFCRTPLLYPVAVKNYNDDPFIKSEWELFSESLSKASLVTIFGYSAPSIDVEAVNIMQNSWGRDNRFIERIEVIDTKEKAEVEKTWSPLVVRNYLDYSQDFYQSRIASHPRRTCEQFLHTNFQGHFVEENPLPINADFDELYNWLSPLLKAETEIEKS